MQSSSEKGRSSGKGSKSSSRGRPDDSAEESVDHSVISHGMARVGITIPARGGNEPRPNSSNTSGSQRSAKEPDTAIPAPADEARARSAWIFPYDVNSSPRGRTDSNGPRTTIGGSRSPSGSASDHDFLLDEAFSTYGVRPSEPTRAKRIACKVANDGMACPSLDMLKALNPSPPDLAAALEFASEVIVENCGRLQGTANGNRGAAEYIRTWQPINDEGAEQNTKAPRSMLQYLLFLCLTSVEEVHQWANIGSGGPVPNESGQSEQATEVNYRRAHELSPNTSEAA